MEKILLTQALVSICMPAYNAAQYILHAIDSVLSQSYQHFELVIVNDGSTDETKSLLDNLNDSRIKIIHTENRGQCAAANLAFRHSTGSLIKFMDADDLLSKDFIELQVKKLAGKTNQIIGASWKRFYKNINDSQPIIRNSVDESKPIDWLVLSMSGKQVMLQCALWLIPRQILEDSGLWDETLSLINDFEFFIRVILHADSISFVDDAIVYYRSGVEKSLSSIKSYEAAKSAFSSIEKGTNNLLKFESSNRVRQVAADSFQNFVFDFYPHFPALISTAEDKVSALGGTKITFPSGGATKFVVGILGWKLTKRIKKILMKNNGAL
ncbi:glycosyltransferase family 2 protein [Pedobacter agri]|uniref:glycosyltransferase family 2 protein n=1 Tax=Pedobacter agri TaxID=454586 RepID=UPI00292F0F10|nr:glycosyltransferase family 2 protein [Pedobacter agri]